MKIILLKNIETLGKKFDVKDVHDGYARNFLFPNKLARLATSSALTEVEDAKKEQERLAEQDLEMTQKLASNLDGLEIEIKEKAGEGGVLFGSINNQKIAKSLEDIGFAIDKSQIKLKNPIKELGDYNILIGLKHGLEAQIKLIVIAGE